MRLRLCQSACSYISEIFNSAAHHAHQANYRPLALQLADHLRTMSHTHILDGPLIHALPSLCPWGRLSCDLCILGQYHFSKCTMYVGFSKRSIAEVSHVTTSKPPIVRRILESNLIIIVDCAMGWILLIILVDTSIPTVTRPFLEGSVMPWGAYVPGSWHDSSNMIRSVRAVI